MRIVRPLLTAVCMLASAQAFAWGATGHQIVNEAATRLMSSPGARFFQRNAARLKVLANTPDDKWKGSNYDEEASTHFFQWDNYQTAAAADHLDHLLFSQAVHDLGAAYVKTNGSTPWRVQQLFSKVVAALKARDFVKALQMAGTMGHYLGDMSQPMHATKDYDGQSIGRRGVHAYFESTLVDAQDRNTLFTDVVDAGGPIRQQLDDRFGADADMRSMVIAEASTSLGRLDDVLALFGPSSQDDAGLAAFFPPCMGLGAAQLAKIWDQAVKSSGVTNFPTGALTVAEPAFFPLQDP
jgi:hypothetical protein